MKRIDPTDLLERIRMYKVQCLVNGCKDRADAAEDIEGIIRQLSDDD